MAIKTFANNEVLSASDCNTYLANAGLVFVKSQTLSGTTTTVTNCFSSTYDSYRIVFDRVQNNGGATFVTMRFDPSTVSGYNTSFYGQRAEVTQAGALGNQANLNAAYWQTGVVANAITAGFVIDLYNPFNAVQASFTCQSTDPRTTGSMIRWMAGFHNATGQYTGCAFSNDDGSSFVAGTVTIYGYRKA